MIKPTEHKLRSYLAEFLVIVLGILMAFQVEEWRDERAEQRDVAAALQRLLEETQENIDRCQQFSGLLRPNALGVEHVYRSLLAGEFINGDEDTFVRGLTSFDVVPDIRMLTSVANEMISTGLLKELDDSALRGAIARLPALDGEARDLLPYWRTPIIELSNEIVKHVDYYYTGDVALIDRENSLTVSTEASMRVNYDFDALASNRVIKNYFFEAVDVHSDLWFGFRERCDVVDDIQSRLQIALNPED
jgi:hypothetical protein